jgi:hypothetical protein
MGVLDRASIIQKGFHTYVLCLLRRDQALLKRRAHLCGLRQSRHWQGRKSPRRVSEALTLAQQEYRDPLANHSKVIPFSAHLIPEIHMPPGNSQCLRSTRSSILSVCEGPARIQSIQT